MKSLKHYFSPTAAPAEKKQIEDTEEPVKFSVDDDEKVECKRSEKTAVKAGLKPKADRKESKSKKQLKKDKEEPPVEVEEIARSTPKEKVNESGDGTQKSNAFQLIMGQKKLSLSNSKSNSKIEKEKIPVKKDESEVEEEDIRLKSKRLLGKPKISFLDSDSDTERKSHVKADKKKSREVEKEKVCPKSKRVQRKAKKSFIDSDSDSEKKSHHGDGKSSEEEVVKPKSRRVQSKAKNSFLDSDSDTEKKSHFKVDKKSGKKKTECETREETKVRSPCSENVIDLESEDDDLFVKYEKKKCKSVKSKEKSPRKSQSDVSKKTSKQDIDCTSKMELDEPEDKNDTKLMPNKKSADVVEVPSEDKFEAKKNSKRKRLPVSENEAPNSPQKSVPKVAKMTINGYFSPISREEALVRAAEYLESPKLQTVKADVHGDPIEGRKRRSMGPAVRKASSKNPKEENSIKVLESITLPDENQEEALVTPKKSSPKKAVKKKRLWEMRVRLLSPVKVFSDVSSNIGSSDDSYSDSDVDIERISPAKTQVNKTIGWGAGGKVAPIFLSRKKQPVVLSPIKPTEVQIPQFRAAPTEHTIGFADENPEAPLSALIPSVRHVGEANTKCQPDEDCLKLMRLMEPTESLGKIEPKSFDLGAIASDVKPSKKKKIAKMKVKDSEPWCEKYKPMLADAVAGNEKSVRRLRSWLEGWTETNSSKIEESDSNSESDTNFIVDDDDDEEDSNQAKKKKKKKTNNTVLLVGPSGCGKTASIYAVAEELGYKVLEVNASSKRSGKRILAELREATQSHQVRTGAMDQDSLNSFFGRGKASQSSSDSQSQATSQILSLILVEDVDIVFEEQDEGFMAALNSLAEMSKRPLILVSNDPNCSLVLSRQHRIHFQYERVPIKNSVDMIEDICETEGEEVDSKKLQQLVVQNNGDLRSSLLSAQFLTLSGGFPKIIPNLLSFPLNLDEIARKMQVKLLPFIINEGDVEERVVKEKSKMNTTWGDSDEGLFQNTPPKIVKKSRSEPTLSNDKKANREAGKLSDLEARSRLADIIASLDILQGMHGCQLRNNLMPGLSDLPSIDYPPDLVGPQIQYHLAEKLVKHFNLKCLSDNYWEPNQSWHKSHAAVDRALTDLLPPVNQLCHRGVSLDYLPVLRQLGTSEHNSSRSSRRSSITILQSIGLHTDQFTLEALPYIFS